ncbi:MAG: glutamate--tRNA ligase [Candidatus Blackburnbacteria bacterium]|nr:glutamate--tRNA ligase [Candidatus Blackburnbacteria bacterium]
MRKTGKSIKGVRTRVAPSPTGFAHVGTAYVALFNYAFAKKHGGQFILRLEDSDVKRNVPGAEEAIYKGLSWLGLSWDEGPDIGGSYGPYRESEKLEIYQGQAKKLVGEGKAYEDNGAIRFKNPGEEVSWNDLIRGVITFPGEEITDFVIMKSDGYPTYNFAVVVDDIEMKISHVIRGEEHISNTPRQLAIYKALGVVSPQFAHLPTLRNFERKKLSKRRDPVDLRIYQKEGYLPEALVNFLCLLGWSHPEEKEVFSLNEFVTSFDLGRVRKAGPIFDVKKLDWINGVYIRNLDDNTLSDLVGKYLSVSVSEDFLRQVVPLIKERISKLSEAENLLSFFWERPSLQPELFSPHGVSHVASAARALGEISDWILEDVNNKLGELIAEKKFKTGEFYMSLRLALTGKRVTPPINESIVILGQDEVIHRLEEAEKVLVEVGARV